ncbi:hypothetical protein PsYK624_081380 [Phanerochaete sordida]|uniref:Uncharacterized protein n=1 Tax=Phanerochaete sordida TaxID=48140 RepID=A0A9P3GC62_9APHY|nr:hypothetical protein PsYK624_081380 [Phanerochaete sordida]
MYNSLGDLYSKPSSCGARQCLRRPAGSPIRSVTRMEMIIKVAAYPALAVIKQQHQPPLVNAPCVP